MTYMPKGKNMKKQKKTKIHKSLITCDGFNRIWGFPHTCASHLTLAHRFSSFHFKQSEKAIGERERKRIWPQTEGLCVCVSLCLSSKIHEQLKVSNLYTVTHVQYNKSSTFWLHNVSPDTLIYFMELQHR